MTTASLQPLFEQWKERIERLIREHPLQIISWEATRRCNMNCVHCGSPAEEANHADELTTDEIVGAFDEIARDFDMRQFRHINITGGEPFVRADLLDVLRRISQWPFYRNIDIQTNGLGLAEHPELLDELKLHGVTGLGISIDGMEESHDAFRRMPGSWAKAVTAARLAVQRDYVVTVSLVVHAKNVDEIPAFFNYVRRVIGPRVFRIMTLDPLGRTRVDSEYLLSPEQLRQVIGFLRSQYQRDCASYADPTATMVELGCGGWLGRELEGAVRPFLFHCIAGITNLGILYDGKLGACSNISRDFVQGDLQAEGIKHVWENRYQSFRDVNGRSAEPLASSSCGKCTEWAFCHGGPFHERAIVGRTQTCLYESLLSRVGRVSRIPIGGRSSTVECERPSSGQ